MAQYKEKFIVINLKRFAELNSLVDGEHPAVADFTNALHRFAKAYKRETGKPLNQKYYVCNQDEPYAQNVIDIILAGEDTKGH